MSFEKSTAYDVPFCLVNSSSGAALTGASVTGRRSLDGGAQAAISGSISELGNGQFLFEGAAADFNADYLVGVLLTASGAVPAHLLLQMNRLRKGQAYSVPFLLLSNSDGSAKTGSSPTVYRSLDGGAQAAISGSVAELGNGQYVIQGAIADFNADGTVGFLVVASGAVPVHITIDMEPALPSDGGSLKAEIYDVLAADAQINNASNLGGMLGLYAAEPYGVYFRNPPDGQDFDSYSVLTYYFSAMAGRFPRDLYLDITAWGDNYQDVLDRVYTLLHDKKLTSTDYKLMMLKWDSALPEQFADDHKVYYCTHRFLCRTIKL